MSQSAESLTGTASLIGYACSCLLYTSIQRDSASGWKFKPSEPPEPLAALDEENEEEGEKRGVLRAVLDGDDIQGEILTPAMSGVVSVFYISNLAPEPLGKVTLSADRRFQISAASLEKKSWQAGRLVIRVEGCLLYTSTRPIATRRDLKPVDLKEACVF